MTKIALGPGEFAGFFAGLKHGFDDIGVRSEHYLLFPNVYGYSSPSHYLSSPLARALEIRRRGPGLLRPFAHACTLLIRILIAFHAVRTCDIFIFPGQSSFFRFHELPLLRLLGKTVIVIFFGSDARPPFFSGRHLDDEGETIDSARALVETEAMKRRIRRVERYADWIINHTGTDQLFSREYIRFSEIGLPVQVTESAAPPTTGRAIRIVHAPSRPLAKGSAVFRDAVDELRAEGHAIDYIELTGVPNARVREELAACDFVLDELYSDLPMAMFATEAAAFGKPAVVGSYYVDEYDRDNAKGDRPPTLFIHPDKAADAVRLMVEDGAYRAALGAKARDFVRDRWSTSSVASRLLYIAQGSAPAEWKARPHDHSYIWGWGLSAQGWRRQVGDYVAHNGWDALMLSHRPRIVEQIGDVLDDGR